MNVYMLEKDCTPATFVTNLSCVQVISRFIDVYIQENGHIFVMFVEGLLHRVVLSQTINVSTLVNDHICVKCVIRHLRDPVTSDNTNVFMPVTDRTHVTFVTDLTVRLVNLKIISLENIMSIYHFHVMFVTGLFLIWVV